MTLLPCWAMNMRPCNAYIHPLPSFLCTSKPLSLHPPSMALCWQAVNRSGAVPPIRWAQITKNSTSMWLWMGDVVCVVWCSNVMFDNLAIHKYLAAISCIHTLSDRIEYVLSQSCVMFANRQKISILLTPTSEMALLWNSSELKMTSELFWLYLNSICGVLLQNASNKCPWLTLARCGLAEIEL